MNLPSQPVDYAKLNQRLRVACIVNAASCLLIGILVAVSQRNGMIGILAWNWHGLALFLAGVFAFCAIASNSLSGRHRLDLNTGPVLCILVILASYYNLFVAFR